MFFFRKIIPPLHAAMEELLKVVDNDTNAFSEYMVSFKLILQPLHYLYFDQAAMKLPKGTADEQRARDAAMQVSTVVKLTLLMLMLMHSN